MKKVYAKPEIQAIELKRQECLLAGSDGKGVQDYAFPKGDKFIPVPEGIDDDDDDV